MLTERFDDALTFASRLHRDQTRKGAETPYLAHLLAVAALVIEAGGDENQAIAALLHDAVEDQGGLETAALIERRFGADVAAIVLDCTDATETPKPEWRARKERYVAGVANKSPRSMLVSLADKLHNATAINRDHDATSPAVWARFSAPRAEVVWYYGALADAFRDALPGPLADEFARAARAMAAKG